jgi:hypothetical protein
MYVYRALPAAGVHGRSNSPPTWPNRTGSTQATEPERTAHL